MRPSLDVGAHAPVFEFESLGSSVVPLEGTTPREYALTAHRVLRELILQRSIPPHTVLKQAEVARVLGVSRTPVREAFRMLQEEGLIAADPNQRATVVGFEVGDLDAAYAGRILLESLAAGMTARTITEEDLAMAATQVARMRALQGEHRTSREWAAAHAEFHRLVTSGGGQQLMREVRRLQDRTRHYLRLAQLGDGDRASHADKMHKAIVSAMRRRSEAEAAEATARHLATTAEHVLLQVDPDQELPAISTALRMVSRSEGHRARCRVNVGPPK